MSKYNVYIGIFIALFLGFSCKRQIQSPKDGYIYAKQVQQESSSSFFQCPENSRNVDFCIEVYEPVCGWFTDSPSECNSRYCRESFANRCFACKDPRVIGYTKGNCKEN